MFKPLRLQIGRNPVAANAVVTQAGDGLTHVQLVQACGDITHRDSDQLKAAGRDGGNLQLDRFAHIQNHDRAVLG